MRSDKPIVAIAVVLLTVMLVGEVIVYTSGIQNYSAAASFREGGVDYSVSSNGSNTYEVVVNDNGSFRTADSVYIYFDERYAADYEKVTVAVGARELNQEYYIQQLTASLEYRGFTAIVKVNADELKKSLQSDLLTDGYSKALIVISGVLPDTVYTGNGGDLIFQWMREGGSLYWLGNLLGQGYSTPGGVKEVADYQMLFFGAECLNTNGTDRAFSDVGSNDYRAILSLMNNRVKYGVDGSKLPEGTEHLSVGYAEDNYSSITFVEFGKGMICILGGDYSNNQRNDLAQVLSARICYESVLLGEEGGSV
ncbi:MAG: hypothetical protein LBT41_03250, partial [Candidatus Methanoplasma sp.]|nr:hypothetical protein [Candidatus Methanoplasma sp.]